MLLRVANPQDLKNLFKTISNQNDFKSEIFIKMKNKCFVSFGVVGEWRVGADPVKFNLGVHGCF